jgi:hypothetical protein
MPRPAKGSLYTQMDARPQDLLSLRLSVTEAMAELEHEQQGRHGEGCYGHSIAAWH